MDPPNDPPNKDANDKQDAPRHPSPSQHEARPAQTIAIHLARLFRDAAIYLGATVLDLIDAARIVPLTRSRAKFPDRAGDFDAQIARLREQRSGRWSSWGVLSDRRRLEIRFAAAMIVVVSILGLRAYATRGRNSAEQIAFQPTPAEAPSEPSPRNAASNAAPSAAPSVDQTLADPKQLLELCKEAAPGQWII